MNLKNLLKIYSQYHCDKIYVKILSPNDNSKNQVYLGGSFEVINVLPIKEIIPDESGNWKRDRFKAKLDFAWLSEDGKITQANRAQLILYPKYPEVRFSGFLRGVSNGPSELMTSREEGRILFFGINNVGKVLGYVGAPHSQISKDFLQLKRKTEEGVLHEISIQNGRIFSQSREKLISELRRIHLKGCIEAKRLDRHGKVLNCNSSNCGGYTLEAELGIVPNGYSEPDYLGWEIKQFSVKNFDKIKGSVITLMTPEPNGGIYVKEGIESFIRKYGYPDKRGRESRLNFGGIHKYGIATQITNLKLVTEGLDRSSMKITDTSGFIGLLDRKDQIAASWSFTSLLEHWNRKHAKACYIPSILNINEARNSRAYSYGSKVIMGEKTDFSLFLHEFISGIIYYDPGIKLELAIHKKRKQNIKRRSQFRIKSAHITNLYFRHEIVDVLNC